MLVCHLCSQETTTGEAASPARCLACDVVVLAPAQGPRVVVGHESQPLAVHIGGVLLDAGMSPVHAARGSQVLRLLSQAAPRALVLDVALEEVKSFEIIDHVRSNEALRQLKIVLVASVFNRTAYKRRPSSLYGADDYVEQHHIPDYLPEKLCNLLGLAPPSLGNVDARRRSLAGHDAHEDLSGMERVRALARSIVSDIALYHQEDITRAKRGEPTAKLHEALAEGRRMLASRVDPRIYAGQDPILDALRALIAELKEVEP